MPGGIEKVMGKRSLRTPRSQIRASLRLLWLHSRERSAAMKRDHYTCQCCGKKQSRSKGREVYVEEHHLNGIEWEKMIDYITRHLLVPPEELETLCKGCHKDVKEIT
jgi:5-methylcytosine-specific restriction endonuclease McrA